MQAYYGSKISENMTETKPDNFLICFNVPIARTGWYEYLASEVGLEGNDIVKVYRSPEDVFDKKAIASFNGKIVTDNHPPELLTPDTAELYTKGAIQNVRQSPDEPDLLLADLIIYNRGLIDEIKNNGKREVSCGYEYILVPNGDGTYSQKNILGNHVAVVDSGRAGDRVAIMDSKNSNMEGEKRMSKVKIPKRTNSPMSHFFQSFGLKHYAQDAEPEDFAEAVDALTEERAKEMEAPEKAKDAEVETSEEQAKEDQGMAALSAKVDKCMELCQKCMEMMQGAKDEKPEDAIDSLISELSEGENSTGDEEESMTIPVEEMDEGLPEGVVVAPEDRPENPIQGADSAIRLLTAVKKSVAKIEDPRVRKSIGDSMTAELRKALKPLSNKKNTNGYSRIMQAQKQNALKQQQANDSAADKAAKLEAAHKLRNPHYKEGK